MKNKKSLNMDPSLCLKQNGCWHGDHQKKKKKRKNKMAIRAYLKKNPKNGYFFSCQNDP